MQFKKFNGTTWETVQHKIYGSGTDSLTAFPAMIQASGEPLTDYLISGNTVQNGTPTPEAPVDVVGCGDRTGNLFDGSYLQYGIKNNNGEILYASDRFAFYIPVEPNTSYTISRIIGASTYFYYGFTDAVPTAGTICVQFGNLGTDATTKTLTNENHKYLVFFFGAGKSENVMLNSGSTALPYEPYGYKIPITVNGTEHPIYLGQVETTRQVKKLALTGEEAWSSYSGVVYLSNVIDYLKTDAAVAICTHYQPQPSVEGVGDTTTGHIAFSKGSNYSLCIRDTTYTSATTFKQYLADQYASGTPVTVWYVLAEPEAAVVNEPMHKIGNYTDTITMAQAEVTIPTSDGDNTITFGTTVQPSAMSATFKGWHPVQAAKQYDGNDWS